MRIMKFPFTVVGECILASRVAERGNKDRGWKSIVLQPDGSLKLRMTLWVPFVQLKLQQPK